MDKVMSKSILARAKAAKIPTLTKRGKQALTDVKRELQRLVRAKREGREQHFTFDMSTIIDIGRPKETVHGRPRYELPNGFCGTAGCVAGSIILNEGYIPVICGYVKEQLKNVKISGEPESASISYVRKTVGGRKLSMLDEAQKILGVSDSAAYDLFQNFDVYNAGANDVWYDLDHTNPSDAITAINRFIRRHGVHLQELLNDEDRQRWNY